MEISWWQSIILGIVQGLAEFLPISSSGHLQLFQSILGVEEVPRLFDIFLHIGTLAAVFIIFRRELWDIIKNPKQKIVYMIIIATVITVVLAVAIEILGDKIIGENIMASLLGINFIITSILLFAMERIPKPKKAKNIEQMTVKDAAVIGAVQGIGTLSGISRSGSTIAAGVFVGLDRKFLARFSFLLSIPAVLGAFAFDVLKFVLKGEEAGVVLTPLPIILGTLVAFVVGYAAIRWMLKLIASKSFIPFSIYTFVLGVFVTLDTFIFHIIF